MKKSIAVLPGDGVGPEIITQTCRVLDAIAQKFGHSFIYKKGLIGASAMDAFGDPFPKQTEKLCHSCDAILFGAIGDPKYDQDPLAKVRPEQGLLKMRKSLGLFANLRPIRVLDDLIDSSPIRSAVIKGVDFVVVRELTGGIYFGKPSIRKDYGNTAVDTSVYTRMEVRRIAKIAFNLARKRRKKVTSVDKANVLETSRLWREEVIHVAQEFSDITLEHLFVDNAAMQIIKKPAQFDVIVTENMFGDILTDEASVIAGSIGLLPSASIGDKTALYEPIHGSYTKAAGKNTANPCGAILSAALMMEISFGLIEEPKLLRQFIFKTIHEGIRTKDIEFSQKTPVGTKEFTDRVIQHLSEFN